DLNEPVTFLKENRLSSSIRERSCAMLRKRTALISVNCSTCCVIKVFFPSRKSNMPFSKPMATFRCCKKRHTKRQRKKISIAHRLNRKLPALLLVMVKCCGTTCMKPVLMKAGSMPSSPNSNMSVPKMYFMPNTLKASSCTSCRLRKNQLEKKIKHTDRYGVLSQLFFPSLWHAFAVYKTMHSFWSVGLRKRRAYPASPVETESFYTAVQREMDVSYDRCVCNSRYIAHAQPVKYIPSFHPPIVLPSSYTTLPLFGKKYACSFKKRHLQ